MRHRDIVNTLKIGDKIKVKGDTFAPDGIYKIHCFDYPDEVATVQISLTGRDTYWLNNRNIYPHITKLRGGKRSLVSGHCNKSTENPPKNP